MTDLRKYPRTFHYPFSPGTTSDDRLLKDTRHLQGLEMVHTEKMDGENTNLYRTHYHARSLDSIDHPSRHTVKGIWGNIKHEIPDGWRICGENMYAKHSIFYENLESYFYVFSIWDEKNVCLSYDDTIIICESLGLTHVPVLSIGLFDENEVKNIVGSLDLTKQEGIVSRNKDAYPYDAFGMNVAKWVRKKHVSTSEHWLSEWRDGEGFINKLNFVNKLKNHD